MKSIIYITIVLLATSCSSMDTVKPWDKDLLAKKSMQPVPDYFDNFYDEHICVSKEASTGGQSVGGGGCRCN